MCVCVAYGDAVCDFRSDTALADIPVHLDFSAAVLPSGAAAVLLLLQDVYAPQEHLLPSHSTPGSHSGTEHLYLLQNDRYHTVLNTFDASQVSLYI